MAVQVFVRLECKSDPGIDSARNKPENQRLSRCVVAQAFVTFFKCHVEILKYLKPSKLHFLLVACIPGKTTANASVYVSIKGKKVGKFFYIEWWLVEISWYETFAFLVWTAYGVGAINFEKFLIAQQVTALLIFVGCFHSQNFVSMTIIYRVKTWLTAWHA